MPVANYLRDLNIKRPGLDKFYRAVVEDVNDPLKLGRVKVRVFPFFSSSNVKKEDLPWAQPCWWMPMQVPPEGSWVWVFFEEGDPLRPVYFGQALPLGIEKKLSTTPKITGDGAKTQHMHPRTWFEETGSTYPESYIFRTPNGCLVKIDDKTGEVTIQSHVGSQVTMKLDGEVLVYSSTKSQIKLASNGDVILHAANNVHIKAAGKIYFDDPESPSEVKKWNE